MVAQVSASPYLGVGAYTKHEASVLTGVQRTTVSRWVDGYTFKSAGELHESSPVWQRELPDSDGESLLSFRDLMELRFIGAFRTHGVSLQLIKRVADKASRKFEISHPFSSLQFKTDGQTVFAEVAEETGEKLLIDLRDDQQAFREVLKPYLYTELEFSSDRVLRWRPHAGHGLIVLDPKRSFGKPITDTESVPTRVLYDAYLAEKSAVEVAKWFEVSEKSVTASIEFEESLTG